MGEQMRFWALLCLSCQPLSAGAYLVSTVLTRPASSSITLLCPAASIAVTEIHTCAGA